MNAVIRDHKELLQIKAGGRTDENQNNKENSQNLQKAPQRRTAAVGTITFCGQKTTSLCEKNNNLL